MLLIRLYRWQFPRWTKFIRVAEGAYVGLWLGLLSHRKLEALDEYHYERNETYNSEAHNLGGLMPWEQRALDAFFGNAKRLAVIGAGGGREVLALERLGHDVLGYECNQTLVAFAREFLPRHGAASQIRLLERGAAPADGPYDGAIMGWSSYALIIGRDPRIAFLRRLRQVMPEGAPLMLSFLAQPVRITRLRTTYRVARFVRRIMRYEAPEMGDDLAPLFVHRFTAEDIREEMHLAGFALAHFEPDGHGLRDSGWAVGHALAPGRAVSDETVNLPARSGGDQE